MAKTPKFPKQLLVYVQDNSDGGYFFVACKGEAEVVESTAGDPVRIFGVYVLEGKRRIRTIIESEP